MIKRKRCKHCNSFYENNYLCDTCGRKLYIGIPITLEFGFGADLDGEKYHFCNHKCLLDFVQAEFKKKENRFIYGEEQ